MASTVYCSIVSVDVNIPVDSHSRDRGDLKNVCIFVYIDIASIHRASADVLKYSHRIPSIHSTHVHIKDIRVHYTHSYTLHTNTIHTYIHTHTHTIYLYTTSTLIYAYVQTHIHTYTLLYSLIPSLA